jgi:fructose-1,6-bisphosphatase/inositol monophosphatase family enzyme
MKLLSFVYGGIQVANGKFSGSVFFGLFGHDVAALKIIVEEAGGKVTDLNGNERRYDTKGDGCIISNGHNYQEIFECVTKIKI